MRRAMEAPDIAADTDIEDLLQSFGHTKSFVSDGGFSDNTGL
jgi:hypothetical protein